MSKIRFPDFSGAKIRDEVIAVICGMVYMATISRIDPDDPYPIFVEWEGGNTSFTLDGRYTLEDERPSLFHYNGELPQMSIPESCYMPPKREVDWSKVKRGTPVEVSNSGGYWCDNRFWYGYDETLERPFLATIGNGRGEVTSWKFCRLVGSS